MTHEEAFTKAFLRSEKRARFIQGLSQPRHRKETLSQLSRQLPYLPDLATEVPPHQDYPEPLEKSLRAKGAGPTCHVVAEGLKADGREVPLGEALRLVCMSEFGAILMCVPGRLAYYKPRSPGAGVILERPAAPR
jgi:hypothetical protein